MSNKLNGWGRRGGTKGKRLGERERERAEYITEKSAAAAAIAVAAAIAAAAVAAAALTIWLMFPRKADKWRRRRKGEIKLLLPLPPPPSKYVEHIPLLLLLRSQKRLQDFLFHLPFKSAGVYFSSTFFFFSLFHSNLE